MWDSFFKCVLAGFGIGFLSCIISGGISSLINFFKSFF